MKFDNPEIYDALYQRTHHFKGYRVVLGYDRVSLFNGYAQRAKRYVVECGIVADTDTVLIVGAGAGWTVEWMRKMRINAWGTETSPYLAVKRVQSEYYDILEKAINQGMPYKIAVEFMDQFAEYPGYEYCLERNRILYEDMLTVNSIRAVQGKTKPTVIITEDCLPCMEDKEVTTMAKLFRSVGFTNVFHDVTYSGDSDTPLIWRDRGTCERMFPGVYIY